MKKISQEKHQKRLERQAHELSKLTIGSVFNRHPNGLACLFQKLVRLRARESDGKCTCVTCGARHLWTSMDAGHYVSRSNKATILDERNVAVQCKNCNRFAGGEKAKHKEYIIRTYGLEVLEELESKRLPRSHSWDREALAEIKIKLLDEIKEMMQS